MIKIATKKPIRPDARHKVMKCHSTICEQKGGLSTKHLRHRGFVLAWTALVIFTVFLLVGLSLDIAKLCLVNHQLHNAADAAALAGGPWAKKNSTLARTLAQEFAAKNIADHVPVDLDTNDNNLPDGDIIVGKYGYFPPEQTGEEQGKFLFIPYEPIIQEAINALAVITSRDVDVRLGHQATQRVALVFGPLAGVDALDLTGNWQGQRGPYAITLTGGGTGAGLICLRHDGTGLVLQGEGALIVNNLTGDPEEGAVQVNSGNDPLSYMSNGTPTLIADIININAKGFTQVGNFDIYETDTDVWLGQPRLPDPLAWLNDPDLGFKPTDPDRGLILDDRGTLVVQNNNDPLLNDIIPAGYYSGGLTFRGGTELKPARLESGIYILDGAGLQVLANSWVEVEPGGAFFYVTGEGSLDIVGTSTIIAEPLKVGDYKDIIFAQDNLDLNEASITGTGDSYIEGTLYFPSEKPASEQKSNGQGFALQLGGTGIGTGNQIIASSVYCFGTGDKIINYDGRNPSPIDRCWLVE